MEDEKMKVTKLEHEEHSGAGAAARRQARIDWPRKLLSCTRARFFSRWWAGGQLTSQETGSECLRGGCGQENELQKAPGVRRPCLPRISLQLRDLTQMWGCAAVSATPGKAMHPCQRLLSSAKISERLVWLEQHISILKSDAKVCSSPQVHWRQPQGHTPQQQPCVCRAG